MVNQVIGNIVKGLELLIIMGNREMLKCTGFKSNQLVNINSKSKMGGLIYEGALERKNRFFGSYT